MKKLAVDIFCKYSSTLQAKMYMLEYLLIGENLKIIKQGHQIQRAYRVVLRRGKS